MSLPLKPFGSVATGAYDDWKTTNRDDPGANAKDVPLPPRETCEKCGGSVAGISVSWCETGHHYSNWPSRPERKAPRGPTLDERLAKAGVPR